MSGIAPGCSLTFSHRFDLEEASEAYAFDGARVEVLSPAAHLANAEQPEAVNRLLLEHFGGAA